MKTWDFNKDAPEFIAVISLGISMSLLLNYSWRLPIDCMPIPSVHPLLAVVPYFVGFFFFFYVDFAFIIEVVK